MLIWTLVIQMATSGMVLPEMAKIPFLIQHYHLYLHQAPEGSVLDFLGQHYGKMRNLHTDTHHSNLPGRTVTVHPVCREAAFFPFECFLHPQVDETSRGIFPQMGDPELCKGFPSELELPPIGSV